MFKIMYIYHCILFLVSSIREIEFLYYEFKRHVFIPEKKDCPPAFKPTMNFEQFENMMPPCFSNKEHYRLTLQSLFTVFKWGTNSVTFDCWVRAMSVICRGTPADKLPCKIIIILLIIVTIF